MQSSAHGLYWWLTDWKTALQNLGVLADTRLTMCQHCAPGAQKAESVQGCIRKSVASRPREMILPFFSAHLECYVWASQYKTLEIQNLTMQSWTTCSTWPCLSWEYGLDKLQRCLPTSAILWVCVILFSSCKVGRQKQVTEGYLRLILNDDGVWSYIPDKGLTHRGE